MSVLRVLLADAPHASRADAWALYEDDGRLLRTGRDAPARWPAATRREAVLAARRARLSTLDLPPMPASRLAAAVAFALEDQLAQTDPPPRIAVGAQRADGTLDAAIAEPAVVAIIVRADLGFGRAIPEAALAPHAREWTWYASDAGDGFVRTPAGAFAADPGEALPPELAVAVAQAGRAGLSPAAVQVAFACSAEQLAAWSEQAGTPYVARAPWHWSQAGAAAFRDAPDWLAEPAHTVAPVAARAAWFRPAGLLLAAAIALHAGGTLAQWLAYRLAAWQEGRELVALARAASIVDAVTPETAVAALVQRDADARHQAGGLAPSDAVPLLAKAAPALATLPPGAIKSASYGAGAWTLELALDATRLTPVDHALQRAGVAVLQAAINGGARLRLTSLP
jgi:hypothetical protein